MRRHRFKPWETFDDWIPSNGRFALSLFWRNTIRGIDAVTAQYERDEIDDTLVQKRNKWLKKMGRANEIKNYPQSRESKFKVQTKRSGNEKDELDRAVEEIIDEELEDLELYPTEENKDPDLAVHKTKNRPLKLGKSALSRTHQMRNYLINQKLLREQG
jgi:hypothetical protein